MAFSTPIFLSTNLPLHKIPSLSSQTHKPQPQQQSFFSIRCSSPLKTPPPISPPFDLRTYWTSYISLIQSDLDAAIPIAYPNQIYESMRYSVLSTGAKRASPIMCIAACELLGGDRSLALPTASALEMVHTASLIHDDLPCMDAAPLRRGSPSNHARFGVDLAVLTGDALFPLAFTHVVAHTPASLVPPKTILRVIEEIARAVGPTGMAAGQMLDLLPGGREDVMVVLEKKFGEMAECSAVCGGLLGGAGEEELEGLRRYGRAVGVLYEVVDDVLMEGEGSNGRSGKMRSNASVVRAMGMERSMEIVEELREKAKEELKVFGDDKYGDRVLPLYSFVDYAVERDFTVVAGSADSGSGEIVVRGDDEFAGDRQRNGDNETMERIIRRRRGEVVRELEILRVEEVAAFEGESVGGDGEGECEFA